MPQVNNDKSITPFLIIGILSALWFALTNWYWSFLANIIISLPAFILAGIMWVVIRKRNPDHVSLKIIAGLIFVGIISSVLSVYFYK